MPLLKEKLELDIQEAEAYAQKTISQFPRPLVWLIVLALLAVIPAYYISRSVSQKIWLARYQQGAIVAKPSFANPKAPKISDVTLTTSGSGNFAAVVQVSNQNLDLSVNNVPYAFTFYNAQKQQIYNTRGLYFYCRTKPNTLRRPPLPKRANCLCRLPTAANPSLAKTA